MPKALISASVQYPSFAEDMAFISNAHCYIDIYRVIMCVSVSLYSLAYTFTGIDQLHVIIILCLFLYILRIPPYGTMMTSVRVCRTSFRRLF